MSYFKKRLSLFLCVLLAFTTVCFAAPQETKAAAKVNFYGIGFSSTKEVQVAKGAVNFYIGDYISANSYNNNSYTYYSFLSGVDGVTYKSSNSKVAKINSKTGKVDLKKTGSATITVTFKKNSAKIKLKVVSKNTLQKNLKKFPAYTTDKISAYESSAKAFLKQTGKNPKITSANRYKLANAKKTYYQKDFSYSGFIRTYNAPSYTCYIYSTSSGRASYVCNKIDEYTLKNNPLGTGPSKSAAFKVTSISASRNSKNITMKLKNKVTKDQLFGVIATYSSNNKIKEADSCSFPITVVNTKNQKTYFATATMKKGSNKITIKTQNYKLKKGTYKLVSYSGPWLADGKNKNTFKVK